VLARCWQGLKRCTSALGMCLILSLALLGCSQSTAVQKAESPLAIVTGAKPQLEEVSPPESVQQLRLELDRYDPQVKILDPASNETIEDTTVSLKLQVKDFPIYKDAKFGLGPHLNVFLDDRFYQDIYDVSEPLTFTDLSPGTHTVRAIAVRPWEESYKSAGAFAQVNFQVFAPTQANRPSSTQPLLTLNSPQGEYGNEPIMLDYAVTLPTSQEQTDTIDPWKVRVSTEGTSFTTSDKGPIYLKGFKPGVSWIEVELLDRNSKPVANVFSETVRLVTVNPNQNGALSQLLSGTLTAQDAERLVDRDLSDRLVDEEAEQRKREALEAKAKAAKDVEREETVPEATSQRPVVVPSPLTAPIPTASQRPRPTSEVLKTAPSREIAPVEKTPQVSPPGPSVLKVNPIPENDLGKEESTATDRTPTPRPRTKQTAPFWSQLKSRLSLERTSEPSVIQSPSDRGLTKTEDLDRNSSPMPAQPEVPKPVEKIEIKDLKTEPIMSRRPQPMPSSPAASETERTPSDSLQKFLDFQPPDPEKLPVIQQETAAKAPSRYLKKSQPSQSQSADADLSESGS
jgi:hypothetical protein